MRRVPSQIQRKRVTASDSASITSALYSLELKRKSLVKRREFLQGTLDSITRELSQIEEQIRELQARHQQLQVLHVRPRPRAADDDETFTLSY